MPLSPDQIKLKLKGATRVVVLGVGSELRGDDAAGLLAARALAGNPKLRVIEGGSAPENCTAEIRRAAPSHLLIIDAAELGGPPGDCRLIELAEVGGYSFSTHSLPMTVLVDFLRREIACQVLLLGIQPKELTFGAPVSGEVRQAVAGLAALLDNAL